MPFCPTERLLELIGTCCVLQTPKVELISQANPSSRLAHTTGLNNPASKGCQAQPAAESDLTNTHLDSSTPQIQYKANFISDLYL